VFEVREEFYKGMKTTIEEAIELCKQSTIVNMIGKCIVENAVKAGLVHPEAILTISGVPHAQIVELYSSNYRTKPIPYGLWRLRLNRGQKFHYLRYVGTN
jgi:hypothetical protein